MNKITIFVLAFIFCVIFSNTKLLSQTYDTKYTVEYALKDAGGNIKSKMMLYRNGSKMKFQKFDNADKPDSTSTSIYIFKDEPKIYNIVTNSAGKFGTKNSVDMMYVGMQTGVYILDLGHDGKTFNSNTRVGSEIVLGMDCVKYTIASQSIPGDHASSDFYMYQDNLMLKRWVGNAAEGNSIEALRYDNTSDVPESIFIVPLDVQYIN